MLSKIALNQVLVAFDRLDGARLAGGAAWQGHKAMRVPAEDIMRCYRASKPRGEE